MTNHDKTSSTIKSWHTKALFTRDNKQSSEIVKHMRYDTRCNAYALCYNMIHKREDSPSNKPMGVNHPQLLSKSTKTSSIQRLGKNIRKLIFRIDKSKHNVTLLNMISKKMEAHIYVFCPRMLHWIFSNINSTSVITEKWYIIKR